MEGHTSAIISYVLFCAENVSESRTVKAFPNQKALWLLSHHPGGCCKLEVDEEISPLLCKALGCLEKRYINVTN